MPDTPKPTADLVSGSILLIIGIVVCVAGLEYQLLTERGRIAPGFVPFLGGSSLVVVGILLLVRSVRQIKIQQRSVDVGVPVRSVEPGDSEVQRMQEADYEQGSDEPPSRAKVRRSLMLFGVLTVALLLVEVLGFYVTFGLLIGFISLVVERLSPTSAAAMTILVLLVGWLVFSYWLRLPLPEGMLI